MDKQKQAKIHQLREWMKQKGCFIHPDVQIPSFVNGYQGVATTAIIPPKTLFLAVPSSLILTVGKCYKDPQLKSIFVKNDDLFDYEASDDCEFNVLCVFLMYHKMNIEKSEWKLYLETIGEPQTAVDWSDQLLKGLNKSAIEEILNVRIQCDRLRDRLSAYLKATQQFQGFPLEDIKESFNYCYRVVMTRCFGYYFGQASLIPVADLINHGCEVVEHNLINVKFERNQQFCEDYKEKSDKLDCQLLGIKRGKNVMPPFRERYLISNGLVECDFEVLSQLNRKKMDALIAQHNQKLLEDPTIDITHLQFCEQDDSEDNDTDIDEQNQRQLELQRMHLEELQQIQNFQKYHDSIKVQTYKEVQDRFEKYQKELEKMAPQSDQDTMEETQLMTQSRNDILIGQVKAANSNSQTTPNQPKISVNKSQTPQQNQGDWQDEHQNYSSTQKSVNQLNKESVSSNQTAHKIEELFFDKGNQVNSKSTNLPNQSLKPPSRATVPIQMLESSESQCEDEEEWGLLPDSYFTLSTSSAVAANKQLFNSYGSRTNRFLLIWYGFCYPDNLYDSVSLRLHVQFSKNLPEARSIVLDTYVGGQGLTFRKNENELVKGNEVSREFRLKMNKACIKLLTFLRLYLLDYYKGPDLYKVCVTLPSSIDYEQFVLSYYRQVIESLYDRYPLAIINELKEELSSEQASEQDKQCIRFKIVYLQEQRRILDENMDTMQCMVKVWDRIRERKLKREQQTGTQKPVFYSDEFDKSYYCDFSIYQLRKLQHYLTVLKKNYSYVMYEYSEQYKSPNVPIQTLNQ